MNWITNLKKPSVKKTDKRKDIPDNFWEKCPSCSMMLFNSEIVKNLYICPHCGYHFKMPFLKRMELLFDNKEYTIVQMPKTKDDPLNFSDLKKYSVRLKDARKKTGENDAVVFAYGKMGGHSVIVGIFNFDFMGGSMGTAVGQAIVTAAHLAGLQEAALILFPASGGARMQEGMLSLMQMARTTAAIQKLKEKHLPYIVVFTNPTTGGVTASFASQGDFTLAEPAAVIGFAGARVIEQTMHTKLPPDFQTAEYLYKHGMLDGIVKRGELRSKLILLLNLIAGGKNAK